MYLSKLTFNESSVSARRLVASPYQLHKALMWAFPDKAEGGGGRVLFRVDYGDRPERGHVLVQSEKEPNWMKAGQLLGSLAEPPQTKPLQIEFSRGQILYFRLLANPTVKRRTADDAPSKRLGLLREDDQYAWLSRKGEKGGFSLLSCTATRKEMLKEAKAEGDARHRLSLLSICLEGVLKVEDPESFVETVRRGVGSAKGLGFGLLSIAPIRS